MRPARGVARQCRTIRGFSCIARLTSWVGIFIASGQMVPLALTVAFGGEGCSAVDVQFESDGAEVVAGARNAVTNGVSRLLVDWPLVVWFTS